MSHDHRIVDTDMQFVIDPYTKTIRDLNSSVKMIAQYDHNSERCTFYLDRFIEGHDMLLCTRIEVHFTNTNKKTKEQNASYCPIGDIHVNPDKDDQVVCSWLISRASTQYIGPLKFYLHFACEEDDGSISYEWNTLPYSRLSVSDGLDNREEIDLIRQQVDDTIDRLGLVPVPSSGIQSDWSQNDENAVDYIKNRPFYDAIVVGDAVTAEETITCDNTTLPTVDMSVLIGEYPTYKVIFDSVEYICESLQHFHPQGGYPDCWYLGNAHLCWSDSTATDEPFCLTFAQTGPWSGMLNIYADDGDHTIQVFAAEVEYTKIDEQFIPDTIARIPDWNQHDNTATDYIKNRPFYECTDFGPGNAFTDEKTFTCETTGSSYVITTESTLTPKDGQSFYIMFDGEMYQCHVETFDEPGATEGTRDTGMGNKHIRYPDLEDNGLPFYLHCTYWGVYVFMVHSNPGTHTIQIFEDKYELKQIDERFIPYTIARKYEVAQSDWTQTDEVAPDYIKNKPFGDMGKTEQFNISISLDDYSLVAEGYNGTYNFAKLCSVKGTPTVCGISAFGETTLCTVVDMSSIDKDCSSYLGYFSSGPGGAWLVVRESIAGNMYNLYISNSTGAKYRFSGSGYVTTVDIVQLDEKFIPDTIARKTDIPTDIPTDTHINGLINTALSNVNRTQVQSDWAQLDETAVDYIKNKPFGESMHIGEALFDKATVEKDSSTVKISNFAVFDIRLDKYYYVVFDNIEYCCKSVSYSGRRWLGNLVYAYPFKDNTGEPFLIEYNYVAGVSTSRYLYCEDNSHTIQIFDAEYDVIPIAEKYITNNVRYRPVKVPLFERVLKTGFTGYSGAYYIRLDDSEQIDSGFTDGWLYLKNNYYRVTVDEYFDVLYNDGEVIHTASVYIDKDSLGTRLCTNSASAPFTLDNEPVRIYSMDGVEPVILPDECVPDTIARKTDIPSKVSAVPDAAGDTVTAAEFNALLTALRNAGYLANS